MQLVGGAARIPLVRAQLQQAVGSLPVLTHLNGDDSVALGCIYFGSGSKFARNKLQNVWDVPSYPIYTTLYRSEAGHAYFPSMAQRGSSSLSLARRFHLQQRRPGAELCDFLGEIWI